MADGPELRSSVAKATLLLEAFRGPDRVLGVSELARRSGLWKSTAHRLLAELESVGMVEREGSGYRLGLKLFELGVRVGDFRPGGLRDLAIGELSRLHVTTGLSVYLAVLEGTEIVYLEKVHRGNVSIGRKLVTSPGVRLPATCTALGKAILAHASPDVLGEQFDGPLPRRTPYSITEPGRLLRELGAIRESQVAREHEETVIGAVAVASPLLAHGTPLAAIGVNGPALGQNWDAHAELVRTAAARINLKLNRAAD